MGARERAWESYLIFCAWEVFWYIRMDASEKRQDIIYNLKMEMLPDGPLRFLRTLMFEPTHLSKMSERRSPNVLNGDIFRDNNDSSDIAVALVEWLSPLKTVAW